MDKLRAMRTFVQIADDGSLTAAATSLRSSLPAVVRTLASLEEALGVRLMNRTTRRLALTEEGRRYLAHCRQILADIDDAERDVSASQQEPSGPISLTAPVLFGQMYVAAAVTRFVQRYPKVKCKLTLVDRVVNLLEEDFDVSVRIGYLADSSLVAHSLGMVRRVVVASPAYLRKHGVPSHPRDLLDANCIRTTGSSARAYRFVENGHTFDVPASGNLEFDHGGPAIAACEAGGGFGSFLSYQVAPAVAAQRLRIVLAEYEEPPRTVSIAYPHARLLPSRIRTFIDALRDDLRAAL
jgi:DNA-binding transcriptional LysR family regulator